MNIAAYYADNPSVREREFSVTISEVVGFTANNLKWSLGKANLTFQLKVFTERGSSATPQITGVEGSGTIWDLYDFRSYGGNENNGWASRMQAAHQKNYRDAGEVFGVRLKLKIPKTLFWRDVYCDDLDGLKEKWKDIS